MDKDKAELIKNIKHRVESGAVIDDKTKEIFQKLEGKKYIEDEFTKEHKDTRALTKEALDIVADYTKGEHEKKCSAVEEAKKIMKDEE